jgi:crotonobetainyl-CoA:carnitine CoA-transferase CaiB-like acyl-CoA transferase
LSERRPLDGIRVLELGQLLAGPFAGSLLGWFGAEVVKVEPPGGDPIRSWRVMEDGVSLWWRSLARNKHSIAIDLHREEGRALVKKLVADCDVLIENFRPGTMEKWGLGPADVHRDHPRVVYVRVSGYGQTGPSAGRPGYASVAEAWAGLRSVIGFPDLPPGRANLSLGDTLAGLHAALGAMMALYDRERSGRGQVVDVALTESVVAVLESMVPEADRGFVRGPSGATITGIAPSNTYRTRDRKWVVIAANNESNFARLMRALNRPDLAADASLAGNPARVARQDELDAIIAAYAAERTAIEIVTELDRAAVPVGIVQDARDLLEDPQLRARGMLEQVLVRGRPLTISALGPKLEATPGKTRWAGPELGEHTEAILKRLGLDEGAIAALRRAGVVV